MSKLLEAKIKTTTQKYASAAEWKAHITKVHGPASYGSDDAEIYATSGRSTIRKGDYIGHYSKGWKIGHIVVPKTVKESVDLTEAFKEVPTHTKSGKPNANHPAHAKHLAAYQAQKAANKQPRAKAAPRVDPSTKVSLSDYHRGFDAIPDMDPHDVVAGAARRLGISHEHALKGFNRHARNNKDGKDFHGAYMKAVSDYHSDLKESTQLTEGSAFDKTMNDHAHSLLHKLRPKPKKDEWTVYHKGTTVEHEQLQSLATGHTREEAHQDAIKRNPALKNVPKHKLLFSRKGKIVSGDGTVIKESVGQIDESMWNVSYDHGPHMSNSVKVSAKTEEDAHKKAIAAAKKIGHRSPMINSAVKIKQGTVEESVLSKTIKSVKRGLQGWDKEPIDILGNSKNPKSLVNRTKSYDDETVQRLHKAANGPGPGFPFRKGDYDGKDKHSPAGLQKRVLDREMKKRGLTTEETETITELSNNLLAKYKKAAGEDASKADKTGNVKKANKRFSGIIRATVKQFDNDAK